ncbi:Fic family protein [Bradyrhizobium sp. CCBAU 51753]|uniref:Fic family protein n=1 Tax=Bradyrhizobium sp. CCBAU 51753 TaxID=1325100 RepID=UPI001889F3B2|nr:Fic family protein [Bradyrhizobium sp. CCBAU 51753]QOZ23820.1 cell filamentation protein Fic [Bradyrhizobium sp. CCBAU 51753]
MADDLEFTGEGDRAHDRSIQRQAQAGTLVRIADGVYGKLDGRSAEEFAYARWAPILGKLIPGAVLSGRTALTVNPWRERASDGRPKYPGWIFCTHAEGKARKRLSIPGLEIRSIPGRGPLEGDVAYLGTYIPSASRKLLENLKPSREREGPSRNVGREGVEAELEKLLKTEHEDGLRAIRQRAHRIASDLDATDELKTLDDLIGTLLGTRQAKLENEKVAARNRRDAPFDPDCMERFKELAVVLDRSVLPDRPDPHAGTDERACVSFIEAYFTNYIEGTRFSVDKARRIVFEDEEPDGRPADGRDVVQTFRQVSTMSKGMTMADSFAAFVDEIKERNRILMDARPEKDPGNFKKEPNYAGNTEFVAPNLVEGTLKEGFEMLRSISNSLARGIFVHTMLVAVHPFNDGNGRTSRIMMTKELVSAGTCRIVVPTIFRDNYIGGLTKLFESRPVAAPLVRALLECQRITHSIVSPDLNRTIELWASTHAFLEDIKNARLTSPNADLRIEVRNGIPAPVEYWETRDLENTLEDDQTYNFGKAL